jgi:hypothetical protein
LSHGLQGAQLPPASDHLFAPHGWQEYWLASKPALHLIGQEVGESSVTPVPVITPFEMGEQAAQAPSAEPPTAQLVRYWPLAQALASSEQS